MDLLYTRNLDAFAIVSSDCDFTPLVMRILTNGLKAYGFGEIKTPAPFVQACSTFLYLDTAEGLPAQTSVLQAAKSSEFSKIGAKKTGKQLKQDTKLMVFFAGCDRCNQSNQRMVNDVCYWNICQQTGRL